MLAVALLLMITLRIYDYSSEPWRPYVADQVAALNAVMPKRGPELLYVPMDGACPSRRKKGVTVCSVPVMANWGQQVAAGRRALIELNDGDSRGAQPGLVCHELMHAVANVGDNYDAYPDSSCVWGTLDAPGPKDVELLRLRFGKDTR